MNIYCWASLVAQTVMRLSAMQETRVRSLGWEDPLEKEMAAHSNILAWKIPWTEEPGRLPSMGSQRVRHDWATSHSHGNLHVLAEMKCRHLETLLSCQLSMTGPMREAWARHWFLLNQTAGTFLFLFQPRKLAAEKLPCQLSFFICLLSRIFAKN